MIPESTIDLAAPMRRVSTAFKEEIKREENAKIFLENRRRIKLELNSGPQKLYYNVPGEMEGIHVEYVLRL
jgi:hypothetical protein